MARKLAGVAPTATTDAATVAFVAGRSRYNAVTARTASFTPALTNEGGLQNITASTAVTVTLPSNASVAFAVGTRLDFLRAGTGTVTFAAGSGATVTATPSLTLRAQWSACTAVKTATDAWVVIGDMT